MLEYFVLRPAYFVLSSAYIMKRATLCFMAANCVLIRGFVTPPRSKLFFFTAKNKQENWFRARWFKVQCSMFNV